MNAKARATAKKRTLSVGGATEDLFVGLGEDVVKTHEGAQSVVLPLGRKIRVSSMVETAGGGAANTSVGLSRLGCDSAFCGVLGSDQWGERLQASLKKEGVETCCATVVEGETSGFSIVLRGGGERVILAEPGVNAHMHDATFDKGHAESVDWIYLNHLHEQSMVILDDVVDVVTRHPKIGLSWNPGGSQIRKGMMESVNASILAKTRLLLLNKEEALEFTHAKTIENALRLLIGAGAVVVCVTDGPNGSFASDGTAVYACPVVPGATIVDSTGAGDAFGTGATWALLQGYDLPTMLRAGTMNATSVLGAVGAQAGLLTDIALRSRLSDLKLDVTVRTP